MVITVIATGFGTELNGTAKKPPKSENVEADSSADINSGYGNDDDDLTDILDLFKGRK